jgi:hypothetical protein
MGRFDKVSRLFHRIRRIDNYDRHVLTPKAIHTLKDTGPATTTTSTTTTSTQGSSTTGVIFTEYANGGTFRDFLKAADQGSCIWIIYHTAKALKFLHR